MNARYLATLYIEFEVNSKDIEDMRDMLANLCELKETAEGFAGPVTMKWELIPDKVKK